MTIEIRFNGKAIAEQMATSIDHAEWLIDSYAAMDAYDWCEGCADEDLDTDAHWHAAKEKAVSMYTVHVLGVHVL
jgi:hypothetical protein